MAAVGQGSLGPNTNTDTGAHTNTLDDTHINIVKGIQTKQKQKKHECRIFQACLVARF